MDVVLSAFAGALPVGLAVAALLYFLLTGFHLLHVGLGIVILAVVSRGARPAGVETGTAVWHMVDLLWIVMFPIIYLVHP